MIDDLTMPYECDLSTPEDAAESEIAAERPRMARILLAEDDIEMRRYLIEVLERAGHAVVEARDGYRVLDQIGVSVLLGREIGVDLVVSDIRMPGVDGLRLLSAIRSHDRKLPVVLITAFGNEATHREAELRGAAAVLDKPFSSQQLLDVVTQALSRVGTRSVGDGQ